MSYKRMTKSGGKAASSVYSLDLAKYVCGNDIVENQNKGLVQQLIERLAELEDKLEQGIIVELPCKVGDTVFFIYDFGSISGECIDIDEGKVDGVSHQKEGIWIHARYESGLTYWHKQDDIGKCLFLDPKEANKHLKEIQEDGK